jgi:hypothetical protein
MSKKHESSFTTYSPQESIDARKGIFEMMNNYDATDEEKERSLALFLRGSLLARIFAISEVYQLIVDIPGIICDVGTWRGQTAVICENLRAIYEPLHFNRRIVCFDTFEGYKGFGDKDKETSLHSEGTYSLSGDDYRVFLEQLLVLHEKSNAMGNYNGKHSVIKGDCLTTIPQFFSENPNEFVSLAFFDVNAYEPTQKSFDEVWSRIIPGGVVAFWQMTRSSVPAEGRVFSENILPKGDYQIHRAKTYPGLCYLVKK